MNWILTLTLLVGLWPSVALASSCPMKKQSACCCGPQESMPGCCPTQESPDCPSMESSTQKPSAVLPAKTNLDPIIIVMALIEAPAPPTIHSQKFVFTRNHGPPGLLFEKNSHTLRSPPATSTIAA